MKELAQNASSAGGGELGRTSRNRYAVHDDDGDHEEEEEDYNLENTDGTSFSWDRGAADHQEEVHPSHQPR